MATRYRNASWWLISVSLVCAHIFFTQLATANDDIPEQAGSFSILTPSGNETLATLLETRVDAKIDGLIATVTYTQSFNNTSNEWVEGIYRFPLSDASAIMQMTMRIGEREIIGKIKEKQKARKIYEKAKAQGKHAALTEQHRANFFSQRVANIAPGETIEIELRYQEQVDYRDGEFEWRLPTTFTPRYVPGLYVPTVDNETTASTSPIWQINPVVLNEAAPILPPFSAHVRHPISINVELNSGLELSSISSPYHDIKIKKQHAVHRITLPTGKNEMDRDFVLQWTPVASQTPHTALFSEDINGERYEMLMMLPPQKNTAKLPRDIVFIIDTSGSMQGTSIEQAKASVLLALDQLSPDDRFNVIEFNSTYQSSFPKLNTASPAAIHTAKNWVTRLQADGGTEMYPALTEGFKQFENNEKLKQCIFITDGAVGNENELFRLIHQQAGDVRLFTVGIGSAPNSHFMKKSAEFGRGTYTHIGKQQETQRKISALFKKIEGAVAHNIHIDWQVHSEQYPKRIGDLYLGEPLVVVSKLDKNSDSVRASGLTLDEHWTRDINLNNSNPSSGLSRLWARKKIESIEHEEISGLLTSEQAKKRITKLALKNSLLSRFTSFVAVEQRKVRPKNEPLNSESISNQVPNGQKIIPLHFPKTATPSVLYLWLGIASFLASFAIKLSRSDKYDH